MFFAIHSCSQNSSLTKKAAIGFAVDCIPFALSLLAYFGVLKLASAKLEVSIGLGGLSVTLLTGDGVALYYANIALKKINNGGLAKPAASAALTPPTSTTTPPAATPPALTPAATTPATPAAATPAATTPATPAATTPAATTPATPAATTPATPAAATPAATPPAATSTTLSSAPIAFSHFTGLEPQEAITQVPASQYALKHPAVTLSANPNDLPKVTGYSDRGNGKTKILNTERIQGSDMLTVCRADGGPMIIWGAETGLEYKVLLNKNLQICICREGMAPVSIQNGDDLYFSTTSLPAWKISGTPKGDCIDFNDLGQRVACSVQTGI